MADYGSMPVTVRCPETGEERQGVAHFSNGRGKSTVGVTFDTPITCNGWGSTAEEFRLGTGSRLIWGQGYDDDTNDWFLDQGDCDTIQANGGG